MKNINTRINKVIELLEHHLFEEPDNKKIAQITNLNINITSVVFELLTGYTIKEYLKARRLSEAAVLIKDKKIVDASIFCGFNSREGFSRAFKAFHGSSPSNCTNFKYLERIKLNENLPSFDPKSNFFYIFPAKTLFGFSCQVSKNNYQKESENFKKKIEKKYNIKAEFGVFIKQYNKLSFFVGLQEKFDDTCEQLDLKKQQLIACSSPCNMCCTYHPEIILYMENIYLYKNHISLISPLLLTT